MIEKLLPVIARLRKTIRFTNISKQSHEMRAIYYAFSREMIFEEF